MKVYFDGGCRPNPGKIETAVFVAGKVWHRADHGYGDNNDAEWLALLEALAVARDQGHTDVILCGDAATVIDHATGAARRIARRFDQYQDQFRLLVAGLDRVRLRRVPRTQNLAGIALERIHGRI